MSRMPTGPTDPTYGDGRTKQSFKDETDVNKLLARARVQGGLSHLQKHGAAYGDFAGFDFSDAQFQLARARSIFEELPGELRREFGNDPAKFFEFVSTRPQDELKKVFPVLAEPGYQLRTVLRGAAQAPSGRASEPVASGNEVPATPPQGDVSSGNTGDVANP